MDCPTVSLEEFVAVGDDMCVQPQLWQKKIIWSLFKAQTLLIVADFDDENEMINKVPVPASLEMRNLIKIAFYNWTHIPMGILFSDEAHFWWNGYVNKQNCRIWSEANSQVYVETPLHPEKLTVWCALWAGGILQKR
ncbi:hypothetical protein TNCV_3351431 [Trichonephila clavipes]|nr:hypothetical protein TNCV_3351431 [Trichonephila clavipes]